MSTFGQRSIARANDAPAPAPYKCPECGGTFFALLSTGRCPACLENLGKRRFAGRIQPPKGAWRPSHARPKRKAPKGPQTTPPRRKVVYERDGHKCVQCGTTSDLTLDHIVPKSKGGSSEVDNLQTMCAPCNHAKADAIPDGSS